MTLLSQNPWTLLIVGLILLGLGLFWVGLTPAEWVKFLFSWIPKSVESETKADKERYSQPTDEVIGANPGCFVLLVGIALTVVGVLALSR